MFYCLVNQLEMTYLFSFVDQTEIKCQHFLQQFGFISEVFIEPFHC